MAPQRLVRRGPRNGRRVYPHQPDDLTQTTPPPDFRGNIPMAPQRLVRGGPRDGRPVYLDLQGDTNTNTNTNTKKPQLPYQHPQRRKRSNNQYHNRHRLGTMQTLRRATAPTRKQKQQQTRRIQHH